MWHTSKLWLSFVAAFAVLMTIDIALASGNFFNKKIPAESSPEVTADETEGTTTNETNSFVDGNLHFFAYHELGHALISEFEIPVAGREEDAVDRLAIWMMTPDDGKEEPEYLMVAMNGWFKMAEATNLDDISWWDEHGTNEQRGYQIACLLYGADEKLFKAAAEDAELPQDRRASCVHEAAQNDRTWRVLLEPHQYGEDDKDLPKTVTVSYEATEEYETEMAYLKELKLFEDLAELMETTYRFKPGLVIGAAECGQANAYWSSNERKLTICYELVREFKEMANK